MASEIKGNQILLAKKYFAQRFGQEALARVIGEMSGKNRLIMQGPIASAAWVSDEAHVEFLAAADKILGAGDFKLDRECGRYMAQEGIPRIYKVFIQFGDPGFVISRADRFWAQVHTSGELQIIPTAKNSAVAKLTNKTFPHKAFCASLAGYFEGVLELCGAKEISVKEIHCVCDNAKACEFAAGWR